MFIFTKISLIMILIIMITFIAQDLGKVDIIYSTYIIFTCLVIQFIAAFVTIVIITLIRKKQPKNGIKIIRYRIEDRCIKGEEDILPEFITTTNPRKASIFKIYFGVKGFNKLPYFGIYKTGKRDQDKMSNINEHIFNINVGIRDDLFIFHADVIVRPDEKINFKFKGDTNIEMFFVRELYIP